MSARSSGTRAKSYLVRRSVTLAWCLADQRCIKHEQIGRAVVLILEVVAGAGPTGTDEQRHTGLRRLLLGGLVQPDEHGAVLMLLAMDPEHVLHGADKGGVRLRRQAGASCGAGRVRRNADGRCHPSQGPPDRGGPSAQKGGSGRQIGRAKGGLNSKLHTVTDGLGRPLRMLLTAGQVSDHRGAGNFMRNLPPVEVLIADRGYDADWLRKALKEKGISPCIPSRRNRRKPISHDGELCRKRHVIENGFAKL